MDCARQSSRQNPGEDAMIADAQVHLWLANTPDRPWLPNRIAQLPEPFLVEQLVPMMDEAGVDRAVIVPPSWEGDRNDYALEAVRRYPTRFAVMGRMPVNDPNTAKLLPDWKKQPGMLGIRLTFHPPQWHWLTDGSVDWFWPRGKISPASNVLRRAHGAFRARCGALSAAHDDCRSSRRQHGNGEGR
jgi:hypothetical protein